MYICTHHTTTKKSIFTDHPVQMFVQYFINGNENISTRDGIDMCS